MNRQPDSGKKADKALESLEGIQRAEPQPYFYTRLTGRLQRDEKNLWATAGSFLAKPVVVAICLGFVLVFNAFIVFRKDTVKESSLAVQQTEQQLVSDNEYVLASGSSFDYENLDQQ
jgi:hypothetical protein